MLNLTPISGDPMSGPICQLTFDLSLILLAITPAVLAAREPAAVKDFSDTSPAELGIAWVEEKRDPSTGFVVGGKNPTALVEKLAELNGRTIGQLEQVMRPGAASEKGFLGPEERLLEVLVTDNRFVSEQRLSHQQLARALRLLVAIGGKRQGEEFLYRGRRYRVELRFYRGFQQSPFEDGTKANGEATIKNLSNGKALEYSLLVPDMIERYGFYEGRGTPYRLEPKRILEVCDFLSEAS
jgi:hypothetical protein